MNIIKDTWERFLELQAYLERMKENHFTRFWMSYIKKFLFLGIIVHEYSHLVSLRVMGFEGVIRSTQLDAVFAPEYVTMNGWQRNLFEFSGGLGQIVYGVYNLLFTSQDDQEIMVDFMLIIMGLIYGYCEAFMNVSYYTSGAVVGVLAGWVFLVLYIIREDRRFFG